MDEKKIKISIYVVREKAVALKHKAVDLGKTMTELLDEIITDWMRKN